MIVGMATDTLTPTNTLLGNPAALKRTLESGGRNLIAGAAQLIEDWRHNGGLPASVDASTFKVGENLAATPGDVVWRNEQLELIQYRPQTSRVHGTPLFIVPPQINKYYVWDLAPERSLIEFLVRQGFQVARDIARSPQLHVLGACSGGITSAALLSYLAAKGSDWARSLTLLVAMLDTDGIADSALGLFAHLETLEPGEHAQRRTRGARGQAARQGLRYRTRELLGGHSDFVLSSSGHVQTVVNPPGNKKASFLSNAGRHDSPDSFEQGAVTNEGTWWPHLAQWLAARSDAHKRAPRQTGSRRHPSLVAAPGSYVMARGRDASTG
jgi:poly(3-hydroxyalkanoate) synthetase